MADFVNHALDGESRVAEIYSAVIICLTAVTVVVLARVNKNHSRLSLFTPGNANKFPLRVRFTRVCLWLGRSAWTIGPLQYRFHSQSLVAS